MCTLSLGPLGSIPFPAVYGFCLGRRKDIGSHIGDWEHMSLFFTGDAEPEAMYVSAHDAGAYYSYNRLTGSFEFKKQETRKGILQRPNFPKTVTTFNNHPVLFAAKVKILFKNFTIILAYYTFLHLGFSRSVDGTRKTSFCESSATL